MSADILVAGRRATIAATPQRALVLPLAAQEARRLLMHPLISLSFLIYVVTMVRSVIDPGTPRDAFGSIDSALTMLPGLPAVLAANLFAERERRAGAREVLASAPAREEERTLALLLASLGPALVALGLATAFHLVFLAQDRYVMAPTVWHLLQGPVTIVGGCAVGVMVARWLPFRGAVLVVVVGLVAVNVWLANGSTDMQLFGFMTAWAAWGTGSVVGWAGVIPGSSAWHVIYLLGLSGMAGAAALARNAERRAPYVAAGLVSLLVAVAGGIGQLP